MRQKDLSSINLQTAAALLATFIKKGRGEYIVIDTQPESEYTFSEYEASFVSDKRLGTMKPDAFYERIDKTVEVKYVYFKPYLTWAVKEKLTQEPNRVIEETHVYFKQRPAPFIRYLTKSKELPEEYYLTIPSSVYAKAEHTRELWSKFGTDYDNDYPFKKIERPYEDKNQVGYYYKPTKEE